MTVKELIAELQKMPEQALLQEARVYNADAWPRLQTVDSVRFEGNYTKLETKNG